MLNAFDAAKNIPMRSLIARYTGQQIGTNKTNSLKCPLCGHNGCFAVYSDKSEHYKCYSCDSSGSNIDFVMNLKHITEPLVAAKDICDTFGIKYEVIKSEVSKEYQDYLDVYKFMTLMFSNAYKKRKGTSEDYWKIRGFNDSTIDKFQLGYCPPFFMQNNKILSLKDILADRFPGINTSSYGLYNEKGECLFADRYIIPIKNSHGDIIAFSGRSLTNPNVKYYNTAKTDYFEKGSVLFNFDKAKSFSKVVIVEGYMDALSLYQSGVENVIAAMGTAVTDKHINMLSAKSIILSLDNDDAGKGKMLKLIEHNRSTPFYVLLLDKYKDLNEAMNAGVDLKGLVNSRLLTGPEYLINYFVHNFDMSLLETRRDLFIHLAKLIGSNVEKYQGIYPINTLYNPYEFDYYWTKCEHLVKGKRGK